MTEQDRQRWDARYEATGAQTPDSSRPPESFATCADHFPMTGRALDIACGPGAGAVWLARRGLSVWGLDVSPMAIQSAKELAARHAVHERCRFDVVDLDQGLPEGPKVDVVLCHLFRGQNLVQPMLDRLAPNGLIATAVLSEVGAEAGLFRAPPGELREAFGHLDVLEHGEADGRAWILAKKQGN